MSNTFITLNGTQFSPTTIDREETIIGEFRRMANGAGKTWNRGYKNTWNIAWSSIAEGSVAGIRTIARLTTAFTFQDEMGTSWTVIVPPGAWTTNMAADRQSIAGIKYYDVTLKIEEQ